MGNNKLLQWKINHQFGGSQVDTKSVKCYCFAVSEHPAWECCEAGSFPNGWTKVKNCFPCLSLDRDLFKAPSKYWILGIVTIFIYFKKLIPWRLQRYSISTWIRFLKKYENKLFLKYYGVNTMGTDVKQIWVLISPLPYKVCLGRAISWFIMFR